MYFPLAEYCFFEYLSALNEDYLSGAKYIMTRSVPLLIYRTWPELAVNQKLQAQFWKLMRQYSDVIEEVWLCTAFGIVSLEEHQKLAEGLRGLPIVCDGQGLLHRCRWLQQLGMAARFAMIVLGAFTLLSGMTEQKKKVVCVRAIDTITTTSRKWSDSIARQFVLKGSGLTTISG